ncbi:uncharacterized protein JCM6883_001611 [Sporobolomyces salmoneus]|uniref:uncharacterized protein n=1 Tax=Sporobolomyces salmoneus TaxID=183962 RepID=UPI00316D1B9F
MYRAGMTTRPGSTAAAQAQYKRPAIAQPTSISVPAEGGRSRHDRVNPNQQRSNSRPGYGRGNNESYGSGSGYGNQNGYNQRSNSSSWRNAGCDGFDAASGRGTGDFGTGRGYRDDDHDPLEHSGMTREEQELIQQRYRESTESHKNQLKLQKQKEEEERKAKEEAKRQRDEEEKARDEERFKREQRRNQEEFRMKKQQSSSSLGPTPSSSASIKAARKVTDQYNDKPPPDLSSTNSKVAALLSKFDDDELKVVTIPATKKDKGKEKERDELRGGGGKGKERAKEGVERADSKDKKKASKLGKLKKKNGFESSPSPEKSKSPSKKKSSQNKAPIKSIADLFALEREAEDLDAEIDAAEARARKENSPEEENSDVEIVDPSKSEEEEEETLDRDELDWRQGLNGSGREETPGLLLLQHEELDASMLCPFCDQPLPAEPSDRLVSLKRYLLERPHLESRHSVRNPKAKYLPIVEIASFCQLHKVERTVIPEGRKNGYPMKIDWKALPERIETEIAPHLSQIILGETPSRFLDRAKQDWERNNGYKRTNVTAEWDSFHLEEPGYYGPRGFECIHSTLRQLFTADNPLLTESHIAPFSSDFYLRRILVPETALELIRLDLDLERDEEGLERAGQVLEQSRAFGKAAHAIVEDVEKERKKAIEDERAKKEEVERKRQEKVRREREEREEAERLEREEEERRIAAETPRFRQPKALANLKATTTGPSPSITIPSSSASSAGPSKKRPSSPDLNELDAVEPKSKKKVSPPLASSITSQPGIAAFMKRQGINETDLDKEVAKKPKSASSSSKGKGKEPLVLDSSSDEEDVVVTVSSQKKKKRRASSPEKPSRRQTSPDSSKKRRASSPINASPQKKSKKKDKDKDKKRSPSPIKDQTNVSSARNALAQALADDSDLESDVETNFKAKNQAAEEKKRKRKQELANEKRKRTIAEKKREDEIEKEKEKEANRRKKKNGKGKEKEVKKLKRPRLDADSSDSD